MDFAYFYHVVLKWKWVIIGSALLAMVVAFLVTMSTPKMYSSMAQVSTGFAISDGVSMGDNGSEFNIYATETKFNNAVVTMTSPTVVSLLSYKLILHDLQSSRPYTILSTKGLNSSTYKTVDQSEAIRVFQDKLDHMQPLTSYLPEEKKLLEFLDLYGYGYESISKDLAVYRLQQTDYIEIDYKSTNPELSAFVVNDIFQEFLRYYTSMRSARSTESVDTLKSMMLRKKAVAEAKEDTLRRLGQIDVGIESTSLFDQINSAESRLDDDKTKMNKNRYLLNEITNRLASLNAAAGAPAPDMRNGGEDVQALRKQMNDAYADYQASGYSDQALYNKYIQYRNRYSTLTGSPEAGSGTPASPSMGTSINSLSREELLGRKSDLDVDQQALADDIVSLNSKIQEVNGTLVKASSKSAVTDALLKDAEQADKDYLDAKQHYNDAIDLTSSSVSNFRQILLGQPAIEPEKSKRAIILAASGVGVILTFIVVLAVAVYLDNSIKTPTVFQKNVNLRLLSLVNFVNLRHLAVRDIIARPHDEAGEDILERQRVNIFREALRKLRFEVENSGRKVFLFTSTKKGEGKTTIIQALSYSMSLSKKRILIVDTNFCNNDLTIQMNLKPNLEKIDGYMLRRENNLPASIRNMSTEVIRDSVYAIGCEGGDYTPSEILPRENLLQQLKALSSYYDYIFLEGPPLNDFSDTRELVQYVDGVIAVFSANHVIKQIDQESLQFFRNMNGKFCGSVLNMVDQKNINQS